MWTVKSSLKNNLIMHNQILQKSVVLNKISTGNIAVKDGFCD